MWVLDASAALHGWDNYPVEQFPSLWVWIGNQVQQETLVIASVALAEVEHKSPECKQWLTDNDILKVVPNNAIVQFALSLKTQLGISNDNYHADGVDENDLLIVATAKCLKRGVVTNEGLQPSLPQDSRKYRIPAVCNLPAVKVQSVSFTELFKASRQVFG